MDQQHIWLILLKVEQSAFTSKKPSKMVGNSASYPVYSRHSELPWIAVDLEKHMLAALIILEVYWTEYFKIFLIFIIAHIRLHLANPVTYFKR